MRSGYSFHHAFGAPEQVVSRLVEIGSDVVPIADHLSTFGFSKFTKLASKAGKRMVYGIRIPCVTELGQRKPVSDVWQFYAKDSLRPLHDLFYKATSNPGREPSLLYRQALEAEGVFKIAGERLLVDKLPEQLPSDFYLGLSPSTSKGLVTRAAARGIPLFATSDNYFPRPEDEEAYRVALGWRGGTQTYKRYILSEEEWFEETKWVTDYLTQGSALINLGDVFLKCKASLQQGSMLKYPRGDTSLWGLCLAGAAAKGVDLENEVYSERLNRELKLIAEKDFEDYFFILHDMVAYARSVMCIGPGRGSSGGSLVCFLLGITAVDPIKHNLIFERFIDANRADLPDCDIDFSDQRRHLVFEYAEKKYGKDRVARLGTVNYFGPKSALNQAGKELKIWRSETDRITDSIIKYADGDDRAGHALEDTFATTAAGKTLIAAHPKLAIATSLEYQPSHAGQHAAGLIITEQPVMEYVAVDARNRGTHCDKADAEALNLLKIDALGLTQLSIFERALELIGQPPRSAFLEALTLDDPETFKVFNDARFAGLFQFQGNAVKGLTRQVRVETLEDIVALTSLARPGPLDAGSAKTWIARRAGREEVRALHPLLLEITKASLGVTIFQEDIMRVAREVGMMEWADVSALRRAMSKSMGGEAVDAFFEKFKEGAKANGIDDYIIDQIWRGLKTFGYYAFPRGHAVAYSIISYWCAWFKAHHPLAFAAATLDAESDPAKQMALLRELAMEGTEYTPVDSLRSEARWSVSEGRLIGPLTQIKGIGPAAVQEIMEARKLGKELRAPLRKKLESAKTEIDSLFPIRDRVKALHPDLVSAGIVTKPTPAAQVRPGILGDIVVIGVPVRINQKDENNPESLAKRNGRIVHPSQALNIFVQDDSGEDVLCRIGRDAYARLAPGFLEKAKTGKSIFGFKGNCPASFRMIDVKAIKWLGEI